MRVLWTHNYRPDLISSGIFMDVLLRELRSRGLDVHVHCTGSLRGGRAVQAALALRKLAAGFDLVHAQYGSVCSWTSSWADCRRLVTVRGTDLFGIEEGSLAQRTHGRVAKWFTNRCLGAYDRVVVMSDQMAQMVRARSPEAPVSIIPDGIDLDMFRPLERAAARSRLGFGADSRPWVLVAGVRSSNPVKRWWLAERSLESLRRKLNGVELKAISGVPHEEMPLWMNAANVVLLTSTHEGWPNVIKEALACNVPFVSTDVSDLRRIAEAAPNCFVVEPDPAAIAAKLQAAIEHPGGVDLRRFVRDMDVRVVADRYLEIYSGLCGRPARKAA